MPAEPPVQPKPATPAPAPAAAPSPATSPAPATPSPAAPASGAADNPFAELDAKFNAAPPAAPVPVKEPPKVEPAPAKGVPPKAEGPKELRDRLKAVETERDLKSAAVTSLEAKIADYEKRGKDTTVLTERLALLEKQMEEKDSTIRALKQEASPEFQEKYDEPFNRLAERARGVVEEIQVENTNPDTQEVTRRTATWNDFKTLYTLNEFLAHKEAKKLFGEDGAPVAMRYYNQLHGLDDDRRAALAVERAKWKEKETTEAATSVQRREAIDKLWESTNKDLSESVDDYHDSPEDKELTEARQKSYEILDAPPKTMKDKIIKDSHMRHRAAAFAPLKLKLLRMTVERDALKKELEQEKGDVPGKPRRPGGTPAPTGDSDSWEDGARKAVTA